MLSLNGCHTAIITPFKNHKIDFEALTKIIEFQIQQGINGIVIAGTTGESPTLSSQEHQQLIEFSVKIINKRCLVIAGTGSNSTYEAIKLTQFAKKVGVNASLQVTPYYNKPTQQGLINHFTTIADKSDFPLILYNVPTRTSLALDLETIKILSQHKNIIAIKEAAGSVDRVSQIKNICNLIVLSGDDSLTLPMICLGAVGAISVLSNIYPQEMCSLVANALNNYWQKAQEIHYKYYDLMNAMFLETNPLPIKTLMAKFGYIQEEFRLPLCSMNLKNKQVLFSLIKKIEEN